MALTALRGSDRRRGIRLIGALAGIGCGTAGALAAPAWYADGVGGFDPNLPDFYQHQNWLLAGNNRWEKNAAGESGGWCMYTAYADAFYDLGKQGYGGLLAPGALAAGTWFDTMYKPGDVSNAELFKLVGSMRTAGTVQKFLNTAGHDKDGTSPLISNELTVDGNGKVGSTGMSVFDYYNEKVKAGDQVLLKLKPGTTAVAASDAQGRWWDFHYVAGAGLDVASKTVFVADPDSNRGSALANAGWPEIAKFPGDPPAGGTSMGLKTAAADPIPIPGTPAAGNAASYTTYYAGFVLNDKNKVASTDAPQYGGTTVDAVATISAPKAKKTSAAPAGAGKEETGLAINSGGNTVDRVFIAPSADVLDVGSNAALFSFTSPGDIWSDAAGKTVDPFGNPLPDGGVEFDLTGGAGLGADELATAMIGTDADFSSGGFVIYLHFAGDPLDIWDPEFIGGADNPLDVFADQTVVPEPAGAVGLGIAALMGIGRRKRRV